MSFKQDLMNVMFNIGKDLKIHHLIDGNMVIEIDYEKHYEEIINKLKEYYPEIKIQDE